MVYLGLDCTRFRGDTARSTACARCPVGKKGFCRPWCDYLKTNFAGVPRKTPDAGSGPAPVERLCLDAQEFADRCATVEEFRAWLPRRYRELRVLSLECLAVKGDGQQCGDCPVAAIDRCAEFLGFLERKIKDIFLEQEKKTAEQQDDACFQGQIRETKDDTDLLARFCKVVENRFSYSGTGSFAGWLHTVYSKMAYSRQRNYTRVRRSVTDVLDMLARAGEDAGFREVKVLAGHGLLDREVDSASVPGVQPWDNRHCMTALDMQQPEHREYLTFLAKRPGSCILCYGDHAFPDRETVESVEKNRGILLCGPEPVYGLVRNVLKGESTKEDKKEIVQKTISCIIDALGSGKVDILAGKTRISDWKTGKIHVPGKLPAPKTKSLYLVDIRRHNTLILLARQPGMTILVYGTGHYGEPVADLLQSALAAARADMEKNMGILLHLDEDVNFKILENLVKKIFRNYFDEECSLDATAGGSEEDDGPCRKDFIEDRDAVQPSETYDRNELQRKMREFLDQAMRDPNRSKQRCAALLIAWLGLLREITDKPHRHPDAFFEQGTIREEYIYAIIAGQSDRTVGAVKKQFSRCIAETGIFTRAAREMFADFLE